MESIFRLISAIANLFIIYERRCIQFLNLGPVHKRRRNNSNFRTTLERVIVIFAIIIGVIGFYFVVSNINSIISNSIKKNKNFSICMTKLEKLKKKYNIDEKIYKLAKRALIKEDFKKEVFDFVPMMISFPKSLKKKLKYDMYINMFGGFRFLKDLPMETVISIGNKMKEVV